MQKCNNKKLRRTSWNKNGAFEMFIRTRSERQRPQKNDTFYIFMDSSYLSSSWYYGISAAAVVVVADVVTNTATWWTSTIQHIKTKHTAQKKHRNELCVHHSQRCSSKAYYGLVSFCKNFTIKKESKTHDSSPSFFQFFFIKKTNVFPCLLFRSRERKKWNEQKNW